MSDYVSVQLSTEAYFQAPFRSVGNGCLIGNGGPNAPQTFWLTRPSGSDYDLIGADTDLKNAVNIWYQQRNAERVFCINTGSVNAMTISDEVPRPRPNGEETNFFVSASPVVSIDAVSLIIRNDDETETTYDLPAGGYSYTATQVSGQYTGEIVFNKAIPENSIIYVDFSIAALPAALRLSMSEDIQFVILCNETNLTNLQILADHVDLANASFRYRIGVAMLPKGQTLTGTYRNWPFQLKSEYMILVAHNSDDDAASGFAGVLSGLRVFDDPIQSVVNIDYDMTFTDSERISFQENQVVCIDNYYTNELGLRALRNFTLSGSSDRKFIDFVRTYQDLMWRLISTLDNPNVIGKISYTRAGMSKLKSFILSAFLEPIMIGEIVDIIGIEIPIEQVVRKTYAQRTAAERIMLTQAKARRLLQNIIIKYEAQSYVNDLKLKLQVV